MKFINIHILVISLLMLTACEQSPTSFDEEPYLGNSGETTYSMEISRFEFDYLLQQFFFSVEVSSPLELDHVTASLGTPNMQSITLALNDLGQDADILVGDGLYNGTWTLPDTMTTYIDSLWNLLVEVQDNAGNNLDEIKQLQPERPAPPTILGVTHQDTLRLQPNTLVLDTLKVEVTHPKGLDEIKSVSLMSLKPDGTYANSGNPITLYDDGSSVLSFYWPTWDVTLTSGDEIAGDGIYSLVLPLEPNALHGTYYWTFNATTWFGVEALPFEDSLIVLPVPGLLKTEPHIIGRLGVFQ